jgi:hypothetical protein
MGVFYTTFSYDKIKISQNIQDFIDLSVREKFYPQALRATKNPSLRWGLKKIKAASRNERNLVNAALLSDSHS